MCIRDRSYGGSLTNPGGGTHHGDWWGGWHPSINREWIDNCVNFYTPGVPSGCGTGYLSNAGPDQLNPYPGRALKVREEYEVLANSFYTKRPIQTLFNQLCTPLDPGRSYNGPKSAAWCDPGGHSGH